MNNYSILIADDQSDTTKPLFKRLFDNDESFSWHMAETWSEFSDPNRNKYDAIILDINLDEWGRTLEEALSRTGEDCPVVLASRCWDQPRTHQRVSEALAKAKRIPFVGTIELNDLGREGWEGQAVSIRSQLRLAIARFRQQGLLELGDEASIRILHLSDPQYGDPGEENLAFLVEKEIPRFVIGDLGYTIHFVAITGDITFSGQPEEYCIAESKLKTLVEAFLPATEDWHERVLMVPGNHDVDMRLAASDGVNFKFKGCKVETIKSAALNFSHKAHYFQPFRDFAWRLTSNRNVRDSEDLCWVNDSFKHLGLRFYMLNTAASITIKDPKASEIPVATLERLVRSSISGENVFGIALGHHGPDSGDDPIEAIRNWQQVGKTIQNSPIRMFIHGHGHKRLTDFFPLVGGTPRPPVGVAKKSEIIRIMAPTTHLQEKKRALGERRGFNIITLNRHKGRVETIEVDSYELTEDVPHRADGAPWSFRV